MTRQAEHDPDMMAPSLREKLRRFAAGLTTEEQAEVDAAPAGAGTGTMSAALREKAERAAAALTPEEGALVLHLAQRVLAAGATDGEADVAGHMVDQYGKDGRPREATDVRRSVPGSVLGGMSLGTAVAVLVVVGAFTFPSGAGTAGGVGLGLGMGL
jgi:hypothetical protein